MTDGRSIANGRPRTITNGYSYNQIRWVDGALLANDGKFGDFLIQMVFGRKGIQNVSNWIETRVLGYDR